MLLVLAGLGIVLFLVGLVRLMRKRKFIMFILGIILIAFSVFIYLSGTKLSEQNPYKEERASLNWFVTYQSNYMGGVQPDIMARITTYNQNMEPYVSKWGIYKKLMPWLKGDFSYITINGETPGVEGKKSITDTLMSFFQKSDKGQDSTQVNNTNTGVSAEVNANVNTKVSAEVNSQQNAQVNTQQTNTNQVADPTTSMINTAPSENTQVNTQPLQQNVQTQVQPNQQVQQQPQQQVQQPQENAGVSSGSGENYGIQANNEVNGSGIDIVSSDSAVIP